MAIALFISLARVSVPMTFLSLIGSVGLGGDSGHMLLTVLYSFLLEEFVLVSYST